MYQVPEKYYFRLHHPRPRFKNDVENVLVYMATNISYLGILPKKEFSQQLNDIIKQYAGNAEKTINNWQTEISSLFGMMIEKEGFVYSGNRAKELTEEPTQNVEDYTPLKTILQQDIDEKYYFSERAVQGMLNSKSGKKMNKGRAQDIEQPSNTVSSHLAKVSLNSTDPVLLENGRYRRYTPREVARIQSFPENYELLGSEGAQYRMLGNAIPPVMMWYIAEKLVSDLRNSDVIAKQQKLEESFGQLDLFEAS